MSDYWYTVLVAMHVSVIVSVAMCALYERERNK